ncbi:hypothetical protein EJP617_14630 [Erwinia sp. Ejp617]|nr:hypothetical protein EJP617_14630 [Erwinia sp. Ejp617]
MPVFINVVVPGSVRNLGLIPADKIFFQRCCNRMWLKHNRCIVHCQHSTMVVTLTGY